MTSWWVSYLYHIFQHNNIGFTCPICMWATWGQYSHYLCLSITFSDYESVVYKVGSQSVFISSPLYWWMGEAIQTNGNCVWRLHYGSLLAYMLVTILWVRPENINSWKAVVNVLEIKSSSLKWMLSSIVFSPFDYMGPILLQKVEQLQIIIVAPKLCRWLLLFYPEEQPLH